MAGKDVSGMVTIIYMNQAQFRALNPRIAETRPENVVRRPVTSYVLTAAGRRQLSVEKATWRRVVAAMSQVLESS